MPKTSPEKLEQARQWRRKNKELIRIRAFGYRAAYKAKYPDAAKRAMRRYRESPETKARLKNAELKSKYGLSIEEYSEMLAAQGCLCAVCLRPETMLRKGKPFQLSVDHNHQTGAVRGLLCQFCNTALGLLNESPDRIRSLADYIEKAEE